MTTELTKAQLLDKVPGPLPTPTEPSNYAPEAVAQGVQDTVRVQHSGQTAEQRLIIEQAILVDLGYTPR